MQKQYSRQAIRRLLEAISDADGIENLVFDLFEEVYEKFSPEMTHYKKVRNIIDYAEKNGRIPDLLEYIRENNPRQYSIFASELEKAESKNFTAISLTPEERLANIEGNINRVYELLGQITKEPAEQPQDNVAELSFDFSAKRYGIGYDIQEIDCVIDKDGSAIVQRSLTILAYSQISSLDTYLLVPESPSTEQEREIGFLNVKSLSPDRDFIITNQKKDFQRSSIELSFVPPMRNSDEIRVQLTEKLPPGLFAVNLNRQQINQRETPYDYFAWNINRPTKRLKMQVFIPEVGMPSIYRGEVRYASASGLPADRIQVEEQKRVQNVTCINQEGRCILTLGVDYPMIGLIYMIKWEPKPLDA